MFPYDTNETTGSLMVAEIDLKSIPATEVLTVFEDRYWSLQEIHSCFHVKSLTVFDKTSNLVTAAKDH